MRPILTEEQRQQVPDMDIESLAKVAFRQLRENPKSYLDWSDFSLDVEELKNAVYPDRNHYQFHSDNAKFLEAITLLERRGLVVRNIPEQGRGGNPHQFIVYLTSIGINSNIDDEIILLVDNSEDIVIALEQKVGSLDPVVRQYYLESLRAYQEGLYISSVICLGAASERAIRWLAESIDPYAGAYQQGIRQRRNGNISRLADYLSNTVIPNIFNDRKFKEKLKERLNGLGNVYRENRNNAGHPDTVEQTSWLGEDQEVLLLQFRRYITTICEARDSLKKQSVS